MLNSEMLKSAKIRHKQLVIHMQEFWKETYRDKFRQPNWGQIRFRPPAMESDGRQSLQLLKKVCNFESKFSHLWFYDSFTAITKWNLWWTKWNKIMKGRLKEEKSIKLYKNNFILLNTMQIYTQHNVNWWFVELRTPCPPKFGRGSTGTCIRPKNLKIKLQFTINSSRSTWLKIFFAMLLRNETFFLGNTFSSTAYMLFNWKLLPDEVDRYDCILLHFCYHTCVIFGALVLKRFFANSSMDEIPSTSTENFFYILIMPLINFYWQFDFEKGKSDFRQDWLKKHWPADVLVSRLIKFNITCIWLSFCQFA